MSKKEDVLDLVHSETGDIDQIANEFNSFDINSKNGVIQMVGAYKAFGMSSFLLRLIQTNLIKKMHDGKKYKLAGFNTFDEFCKGLGISRRTAYRLLKEKNPIEIDAYKSMNSIGLTEKDIKVLHASGATITEEQGIQVINVSGVSVPIGPESKDELSEIISDIVKKRDKAERELKQAQREIEKKEEEIAYANDKVAEVLKPFSGHREDFQSSLEQIQRDFDVICTKMHMHWNKADSDRIKESMVTSTTHWLNERVVDLIDAFVRMEE